MTTICITEAATRRSESFEEHIESGRQGKCPSHKPSDAPPEIVEDIAEYIEVHPVDDDLYSTYRWVAEVESVIDLVDQSDNPLVISTDELHVDIDYKVTVYNGYLE